jgi:hypothetical protein
MNPPPTRLIWKLDVYDDAGNVIASFFRCSNSSPQLEAPGLDGDSLMLAEALHEVKKAARFIGEYHHDSLPTPPQDISSN